jgi:PAS domain-containing protein
LPLDETYRGFYELLAGHETFLAHILPDDRPAVEQKFHHSSSTRAKWGFECRIRRPDGIERWIWVEGKAEQEADKPRRMKGRIRACHL